MVALPWDTFVVVVVGDGNRRVVWCIVGVIGGFKRRSQGILAGGER